MIYDIYDVRSDLTAHSKAPDDIQTILKQFPDVVEIPYVAPVFRNFWELQWGRIKRFLWDLRLITTIPRKSTIFLQLPGLFLSGDMGAFLVAALVRLKKMRIIVLIHDIDCIRHLNSCKEYKPDRQLQAIIRYASAIIVHNPKMGEMMVGFGADSYKIVNLQIFDYIANGDVSFKGIGNFRSVAIAGNLSPSKAGYLVDLQKVSGIEWHLFGVGYDAERIVGENIHYEGSFPPENLPEHLIHGFGLVWDGDSIDTCSGPFGEYLRVNNPHKLSLYLASGMPVFIWDQAAEAEFVRENRVGLTISSLHDIPRILEKTNIEQYEEYRNNALKLVPRLRKGEFFGKAFAKAVKMANV